MIKNNSTYILGTGLSHNCSTCILKDGKLIVAIEKERISRIKHDGGNDYQTVQYCLDAAGITHNDNSARVQTVTKTNNAKYYELISAFKKETGLAILLNTSLNKRGMPIVETPLEALNLFYETMLDVLVINNIIVTKS